MYFGSSTSTRGSGLLVDTNLLLLYLIGRTNKNRISKFKRTQAYTIDIRAWFVRRVEGSREHYDESRQLVKETCFQRLGLTEAAIAALARRNCLLLTDDFDLYSTLVKQGVDAINFNHLRSRDWHFY